MGKDWWIVFVLIYIFVRNCFFYFFIVLWVYISREDNGIKFIVEFNNCIGKKDLIFCLIRENLWNWDFGRYWEVVLIDIIIFWGK